MFGKIKGLIAWIKMGKTLNDLATDAKGEVNTMEGAKPGWKTTEFWGARMTQIVAVICMVAGFKYNVTPELQAQIVQFGMGIIGSVEAAYSISRGLTKKS